MLTDLPPPKQDSPPSMGPLVGHILEDALRLFRQELAMARSESNEGFRDAKEGGLVFAAGAILGSLALLTLTMTLVHLLAWSVPSFPIWLDYAAVTLAWGIPSAILLVRARGLVSKAHLIPWRTLDTVKETAQRMKGKL